MWRPDHIPTVLVDLAAEALQNRAAELETEQAVYGLDALAELEFHPLLLAAFRGAGLGAWPETPYPGQPGRRPKHSERERCDLAVTAGPDLPVRDPVALLKEADLAAGTLFASALGPAQRPGVEPEEAFWLEVKLVGQFCYSAGVPGPNRTYSSELLRTVPGDIPKLSRDRRIRHAGLLIILFTRDAATAEHDLAAVVHKCLDRGLPVGSPVRASFGISDRIGNSLCTVAVVPVNPGARLASTEAS